MLCGLGGCGPDVEPLPGQHMDASVQHQRDVQK